MSTSALIGLRPIARSRFCIHSGDGPFLTPRTRRSAKAGQRCASSGAKSSLTAIGQSKPPGDRARRVGLQLAEAGGGEIARDAGDAGRVGPVGGQVDVDHGIVEAGVGRIGDADRRVVGQFDDAVVVVGKLELGRRAQHAVRTRRRG